LSTSVSPANYLSTSCSLLMKYRLIDAVTSILTALLQNKQKELLQRTKQLGSIGDAYDFCSRDAIFESRPGHRLL
jgi:hypothetical protein